MEGKLVIFSAPSGSGKTTIVNAVKEKFSLHFSVSATTRAPRGTETHEQDYIFLSVDEFKQKIAAKEFIEYEEVYPGKFYGTLKKEVDKLLQAGNHVVFDVDVVGGLAIKKAYPSNSISIFIQAPSIEELENRLIERGTDSKETIQERIKKASIEMEYAPRFDRIITNTKLNQAITDTEEIIGNFLNK